jgi:hypothetical protein
MSESVSPFAWRERVRQRIWHLWKGPAEMEKPDPIDSEFMRDVQAEIAQQEADESLVVAVAYVLAFIGAACAAYQSFQARPTAALGWAVIPLVCVPLAHAIKSENIPPGIAKWVLALLAVPGVAVVLNGFFR